LRQLAPRANEGFSVITPLGAAFLHQLAQGKEIFSQSAGRAPAICLYLKKSKRKKLP
jgi:hypothetical protein